MITHIIHGSDIPKSLASAIGKQLGSQSGILKFTFHTVDDRHLERGDDLTLQELFEVGHRFRKAKGVPGHDFVINLTARANAQNFYASLDPADLRTGFVHAGDWELFIECERELPVAFTIVNLLVAYYTCPVFDQLYHFLHHKPIGCANDLCYNKREVIFKLRTGDVCADCIRAMQRNGWSDLGIDHALRIMTDLSTGMRFNRFFEPVMEPSSIRINMEGGGVVTLPEYGNLNIPIPPIDLAYYVFYLRYSGQDGLFQSAFTEKWAQAAIHQIYWRLRPNINERELNATVRTFGNVQIREQSRSRIKKIFTSVLGPRLAKPYLIEGIRGKPSRVGVPLTRVHVRNFGQWMDLPDRP